MMRRSAADKPCVAEQWIRIIRWIYHVFRHLYIIFYYKYYNNIILSYGHIGYCNARKVDNRILYYLLYRYAYLQYQRGKLVPRAMVLHTRDRSRRLYVGCCVHGVFFSSRTSQSSGFFINIVLETGFCIYLNSSRPIRKCEFYYNENDFPYELRT